MKTRTKMILGILLPLFIAVLTVNVVAVMAKPAETSVNGGGWIIDQWGDKCNFGATVAMDADRNLKGQVEYNSKGERAR